MLAAWMTAPRQIAVHLSACQVSVTIRWFKEACWDGLGLRARAARLQYLDVVSEVLFQGSE